MPWAINVVVVVIIIRVDGPIRRSSLLIKCPKWVGNFDEFIPRVACLGKWPAVPSEVD